MSAIFWYVYSGLIYLAEGLIMSFVAFSPLDTPKGKKFKNTIIGVSAVIVGTVNDLFSIIGERPSALRPPVMLLLLILISFLCFKGSVSRKAFFPTLAVLGFILCSMLSVQIISIFTGVGHTVTAPDKVDIFSYLSLFVTLLFLVYMLFMFRYFRNRASVNPNYFEWLLIFALLGLSILMMFFLNLAGISKDISAYARIWLALTALCVVVVNVITLFLVSGMSRNNELESENMLVKLQQEAQENENLLITEKYEELHKQKHDFKNQINVLEGLISCGEYDDALEYIERYSELINSKEQSVVKTSNTALNAILNNKIARANSLDIKVETTAIVTSKIFISELDMCSLIGNLFDNAIEAAEKCQKKFISFKLTNDENQLIICIKNTINASVIENNPDFATTKKGKESHGYGMKIIKRIIRRGNGIMDTYEQDGMLCQMIVMNKV